MRVRKLRKEARLGYGVFVMGGGLGRGAGVSGRGGLDIYGHAERTRKFLGERMAQTEVVENSGGDRLGLALGEGRFLIEDRDECGEAGFE